MKLRADSKLIVKSDLYNKIKQYWDNVECDKNSKGSSPSKKMTIMDVKELFLDWWGRSLRKHGPKSKRNNHLNEFAYIFNYRHYSQWQRFETFMDRACNTKNKTGNSLST